MDPRRSSCPGPGAACTSRIIPPTTTARCAGAVLLFKGQPEEEEEEEDDVDGVEEDVVTMTRCAKRRRAARTAGPSQPSGRRGVMRASQPSRERRERRSDPGSWHASMGFASRRREGADAEVSNNPKSDTLNPTLNHIRPVCTDSPASQRNPRRPMRNEKRLRLIR